MITHKITNSHTNLIGITGFFLPKLAVKINPTMVMKANWKNVTIWPLLGISLKNKRYLD